MEATDIQWIEPRIEKYGPRSVRLTTFGTFALILVRTLPLLIVGWIAYAGIDDIAQRQNLEAHGTEIQADVVDVRPARTNRDSPVLTYQYMTDRGVIRASATAGSSELQRLQVGSKLPIVVLPNNPAVNEILPLNVSGTTVEWVLGGLFAAVFSLMIWRIGEHHIDAQRKALSLFTAYPAQVVKTQSGVRYRVPYHWVTYRKDDGIDTVQLSGLPRNPNSPEAHVLMVPPNPGDGFAKLLSNVRCFELRP